MKNRKRILFEDIIDGPEWVALYKLHEDEYDDDMSDSFVKEIIFNAVDFESAAKYAQQYLRKMQLEEETSSDWEEAEILSVELKY